MAKSRRRNRGRRRKRANNNNNRQQWRSLTSRFQGHQFQRSVELDFVYAEQSAAQASAQAEYRQRIADMEKDALSRTIYVVNVKDLRQSSNLSQLKTFFQQKYGPVQLCQVVKGNSKYPCARVRFQYRHHAETIFGGRSLQSVLKQKSKVDVPSSVGNRGMLGVRAAFYYKGMVDNAVNTGDRVELPTESIALGHWFPTGHDAYETMSSLPGGPSHATNNLWLEERPVLDKQPILRLDLQRMVVELDFTHCDGTNYETEIIDPVELIEAAFSTEACSYEKKVVSFRFKDLRLSMALCQREGDFFYDLLFSLKLAPRLYYVRDGIRSGREYRTRLTGIAGVDGSIFGRCLGYRIRVTRNTVNSLLLNTHALEKLKKFGVFEEGLDMEQQANPLDVTTLPPYELSRLLSELADIGHVRCALLLRSVFDAQKCNWYHALYDTVLQSDGASKNLFQLVNEGPPGIVSDVLTHMRDMQGQTRYPAQLFYALFEDEMQESIYESGEVDTSMLPDFCVELPRVLITPCREIVTGFEVEMSNRVIRKFVEGNGFSPEAFARVSLGDESGERLFADDLSDWRGVNGPVSQRIKSLLLSGLWINGRQYQFLAYSSSQLKEASVWMVCPEYGWTIGRMRDSMGDFSGCKTPYKYAARIGQCFSTTVEAVGNRSRWRVKIVPDIAAASDLVHSDGAGLIRKEVLAEIAPQLPFRTKELNDISAIQIRFGGAKGVLTAWDFSKVDDYRCRGYDICLRESMIKFKAPYDNLEVITIAKHVPYFLNRHVILLLKFHDVANQIFLDMQSEMFQNLNAMLCDANVAKRMTQRLALPDTSLCEILMNMLSAGLSPDKDPFLFSSLHAIRAHHLMNLRKKARIFVEKGTVLVGGIDELNLLSEGCVHLQVRGDCGNFQPIVGPVMITKHPVMHPGDVRMYLAVDLPELRAHRNMLLFSQKGARPEADKMSGSDLDGDQFAVTWDDRLFIQDVEPMDYSPPSQPVEVKAVNDDSLISHLINFARSDTLGRIANLWLDHAAQKSAGCQECITLAELHSIAVDFPKSGVPAIIPRELFLGRHDARAHWREKKEYKSFHCESIIGLLYDQVTMEVRDRNESTDECQALAGRRFDKNGQILIYGNNFAASKMELYDPVMVDRLGWSVSDEATQQALDQHLLSFAMDQREMFERTLMDLMNKYKIKCEGEVVTGWILKCHKLHKRRQHDIAEDIRRQTRKIRREFREEFFGEVFRLSSPEGNVTEDFVIDNEEGLEWVEQAVLRGDFDDNTTFPPDVGLAQIRSARTIARRLAAAYYIATYSNEWHWDNDELYAFFSFPWLIAADVITSG